jgi:hypothetical protein
VADIASVRFSLPAQLLEPRPNLGMSLFLVRVLCGGSELTGGGKNTGITLIDRRPLRGQQMCPYLVDARVLTQELQHWQVG